MKNKLKNFFINNRHILLTILPFILIDGFSKILAMRVSYLRPEAVIANLVFTAIWIGLFVSVISNVNKTAAKILYWLLFIVYFAVFFTNGVYISLTGFFFSFNLIFLASEGSAYIWDTIMGAEPIVYIFSAIIIICGILCSKAVKGIKKTNYRCIFLTAAIFVILHIITPNILGQANSSLKWDNWRNPRNVYNNFNDSNKNFKICGIYEYTFRDIYITFFKGKDEDPDELAFLDKEYSTETKHNENRYTGILKGKNVIFLQLEGLDSWLLTKETTPNLYSLLENSINFSNHYSYYNGGGSTFNSEFAVNTGFLTPVSYTRNAYTFNSNLFENSLPKIFKEMGYRVNAFHMNTNEYYSRGLNYKSWGYDEYYGLLDINKYSDLTYELDRELFTDKTFYKLMFKSGQPFLHYIITYTPHTPFTTTKGLGKFLGRINYGDNVPDMSEEETAKMFASETDYAIGLMLDALEENNLLDNTVIVAYADHYLYTLNDKTILDKYKETDNNLINHTPFFIWSKDINKETVTKVNSQLDILPTVLNLFGIEYNNENYIGQDIFNKDYSGYVFFNDYSWFDGTSYVENGTLKNASDADGEYIKSMNNQINLIIQRNDMTLKYDYFRRKK